MNWFHSLQWNCVSTPGQNSTFCLQFAARSRSKFCPCYSEHTPSFLLHYPDTRDRLRRDGSMWCYFININKRKTSALVFCWLCTCTPGVEEHVEVVWGAGEQQSPPRWERLDGHPVAADGGGGKSVDRQPHAFVFLLHDLHLPAVVFQDIH